MRKIMSFVPLCLGSFFFIIVGSHNAGSAGVDSPQALEQARICAQGPLDREQAVPACNRALSLGLSPRLAGGVQNMLGVLRATTGDWSNALPFYRRAAQLKSESAVVHLNLGLCLSQMARYREAEAALRQAARLNSRDPLIEAVRGAVLNKLGRHEEALGAFAAVERVEPGYLDEFPGDLYRPFKDASASGKVLTQAIPDNVAGVADPDLDKLKW